MKDKNATGQKPHIKIASATKKNATREQSKGGK